MKCIDNGSQAAVPDHSPNTDERASLAQPTQSSSPLECTSYLGFSLDYNQVVSVRSLNSPKRNAGVQCYQSSIVRNRQGEQVNVR